MEKSVWEKGIESSRQQKDEFFKMHFQSPLPPEQRQEFKGLDYYSPDRKYRFELELHEHKVKERLKIKDTQGNERDFFRWGEFRFKIGDKDCKLHAYKSLPGEERLFVPFRDASSGKETYGAGRYLDFEVGKSQTPEGKWIVDFNEAYNPWCAYNKNYACPFTPPENWLEVEMPAGEKNYPFKSEGA